MERVANILGFTLPSLKARDAVMKAPIIVERSSRLLRHQDSFVLQRLASEDDDDGSVSTVSARDIDYSFSSSMSVRFCEPLVTEVYTRPFTTEAEKQVLFYSDQDYLLFRLARYQPRRVQKRPVVRFAEPVVTEVHEVECWKNEEQLYYSKEELKQ